MQHLRESSSFAPILGAVVVLGTTAGLLGGFTPVRTSDVRTFGRSAKLSRAA